MTLNSVSELDIRMFFDYIKTIRYGYQDKNGNLHFANEPDFYAFEYAFSSPEEVVNNNCGWCWDVANLIGMYCEKNSLEFKTYFLEYRSDSFHQTHTQVLIRYNGEWYAAPDNSSSESFGKQSFTSAWACICDFKNQFEEYLRHVLKNAFDPSLFLVKEFNCKIPPGISDEEYMNLVRGYYEN